MSVKNSGFQKYLIYTSGTIVVIVIAVIGYHLISNLAYRNVRQTNDTTRNNTTTPDKVGGENGPAANKGYTLSKAVGDMRTALITVCSGASIEEKYFKQVWPEDTFVYEGGVSRIDTNLTQVYVQYGCGSEGDIAIMKRALGNTWIIIDTSARMYPLCDRVVGSGIADYIVDKCYPSNQATEAVAIKS